MSQSFSNELFQEQLAIGATYELMVYQALIDAKIPAKYSIPFEGSNYTKYQKDIVVDDFVIEVKSRNLDFGTDPRSFPFSDAVLETVWGWNQKATPPRAVIFVSQRTHAMLAVNVQESFEHWTQRKQWDGLRKIESIEYFIPSSYLRTFKELVDWLYKEYAPDPF